MPAKRLRFRLPRLAQTLAASVLLIFGPTLLIGQVATIESITITGNQRVDDASVRALLGLREGQEVTTAQVNDAYQRLMAAGLFESATITPDGAVLSVVVREWPVVNRIAFEGNQRLDDAVLAGIVTSRERRVYSPLTASADAAALVEAYRAAGRASASVEPKVIPRDDGTVDLVFEIAEGGVIEVERIAFIGNEAFSDSRLRRVLLTKQAGLLRTFISADTYAPERLELDRQLLRDFYLSRGFIDFRVLDASADYTPERDAFLVRFTLREGAQFRFGAFEVTSEYPEADTAAFLAANSISTGDVFSPLALESAVARMEALALRQGLSFLRVEPRITRNDATATLDVSFALVRGPRIFVERIDIEGNVTTLDRVIRRQFRIVEGDPFNPRAIREAAERIRALGFFETANVDTRQGSAPDQVVVDVSVTERPTGSLAFGASYGEVDGAAFTFNLSESNFLGRGQFISVEGNLGAARANTALRFAEPAFLGRDLRASIALANTRGSASYLAFDSEEFEFRPALEFPTTANGRLEGFFRIASSKLTGIDAATTAPILVTDQARGDLVSAGFGYGYSWDSRRAGLGGDEIVLLRVGQELQGLGGDVDAFVSTASAIYETKRLGGDLTLRATLEAGHLETGSGQASRITDRFSLAGKMRGFEPYGLGPRDVTSPRQDALAGNTFAVARLDAEFPLGLPEEYGISGGVFFDVGSVWSLDDRRAFDGSTVDDTARLRSAVGVSVLWDTPIGPLRFNFATPLEKQSYDRTQGFDLTIATRF